MLVGQLLSEHWFSLDSFLIAVGMLMGWFLTQLVLSWFRREHGQPEPASPARGFGP